MADLDSDYSSDESDVVYGTPTPPKQVPYERVATLNSEFYASYESSLVVPVRMGDGKKTNFSFPRPLTQLEDKRGNIIPIGQKKCIQEHCKYITRWAVKMNRAGTFSSLSKMHNFHRALQLIAHRYGTEVTQVISKYERWVLFSIVGSSLVVLHE